MGKEDYNSHIIRQSSTQTVESWIAELMDAFLNDSGALIQYRYPKSPWIGVGNLHVWDFTSNEYRIKKHRQYIIGIKNNIPSIVETSNCWSESDFATDMDGTEYFLVREVPHK